MAGKKGYQAGGGAAGKKKKGGGVLNSGESEFFLHHYPDGDGPDAELIRTLERDMVSEKVITLSLTKILT